MLSSSSELVVRLDTALAPRLWAGRGNAMFLNGACFHRSQEVRRGWLWIGGERFDPAIWRAPRLDLAQALGEPRAYLSGFWATLPIRPPAGPGRLAVELEVELADGRQERRELGELEVGPARPAQAGSSSTIAICLATHEPDPKLLTQQIESLRAQTDTDWICLVGDDSSSPERFGQITRLVGEDPRFSVSRSETRLGPYRNFERLLCLLGEEPSLVALSDQDDRWHPEKLSVLRSELGSAQLAYSDQRVVDRDGAVLSPTMWQRRRNQWQDLASLLIANSVTGAAALIRREVVDLALPFPEVPGLQLHDHWLAMVALATGQIRYVDRPLSDYVQHADAVLGRVRAGAQATAGPDARAAYFYGYVPRQVQATALLERGGGRIEPAKRRPLERLVAGARSPWAWIWLLAHGLGHRQETLGTEFELARGIVWKALIGPRARRARQAEAGGFDASCPPPSPDTLGAGRLARWRATL
jgi:hypothetical protein